MFRDKQDNDILHKQPRSPPPSPPKIVYHGKPDQLLSWVIAIGNIIFVCYQILKVRNIKEGSFFLSQLVSSSLQL